MTIRLERFTRATMTAEEKAIARNWGMADDGRTVRTVSARQRFTLPRLTESFVLKTLVACATVATLAAAIPAPATAETVARIIAIDYMGNEFVAGEGDTCAAAEVGMVLPVGVVEFGCHIETK